MLARSAEPFDSDGHLFEIKWDGTRCLAFIEPQRLQLQNRRFIEMRPRYPELACLNKLPPGIVLDGEIIVLSDGKPSFNKLQQREHLQDERRIEMLSKRLPGTLMVFDLLYLKYASVMDRPLRERRRQVEELISSLNNPHVLVPDYVVGNGTRYFEEVARHGLEGIMAKRLDSLYLPGKRSNDWLKIKVARTAEYAIIGFTQREQQPVISALVLGMHDRRRLIYKGKVGSGFTEEQRGALYRQLVDCAPLDAPPAGGPRDALWRETGLHCKVRFFEKTKTGMLRAPVFLGIVEP